MNPRLESILEAIIAEYIETAEPVGSLTLSEKYRFPYSPATIRACMAVLEEDGYISQPHTSAGRIPTEKGYRYFVDMIKHEEEELQQREERMIQRRLNQQNARTERLVDIAAMTLADMTGNVGVVSYADTLYSHGLSNLFRQPEFLIDPSNVLRVAEVLDRLDELIREIPRVPETTVYIGSESPIGKSSGCSLVVSSFVRPELGRGYLLVLGPTRMFYPRTIAVIDEVKSLLEVVT
ncbi:MAG: transcriptional regulator [Patescibacteria group bacterium]